jgi:hypothetical protein
MESTLSVSHGYGVLLPWGDEGEFDFSTNPYFDAFQPDVNGIHDVVDDLETRFSLLCVTSSYDYEWSGPAVLFIAASVNQNFGVGVTRSNVSWAVSRRELLQLEDACALLGVPHKPFNLTVVSFG